MMKDDFERVLCGRSSRGLYESHYIKANDPNGGGAFWFKYNLLAPFDESRPRFGELWAVYWKGPGQRPLVIKEIVGEDNITTDPQRLALDLASASLRPERAKGAVESDGHRVSWDLQLSESDSPIFQLPYHPLYRTSFPKKKLLVPRPRQVFDGTLVVDDEEVPISGWVGIRGHNWGSEHVHTYAYGNANLWDRPGRWVFDAWSARVFLGSTLTPWLSSGILRLERSEQRFNSPWRWYNRTAHVDFPSWSCTFRNGQSTVRTRWIVDPEDIAGLRYLHPDGKCSYCYKTNYARLELELERRGAREHRASNLAELEFLTPAPIPGIPLHGDDLLP